jgi:hypothetical protein
MTPIDPRLPIIAREAKVKTCHVFHCWHAMRDMGAHFHPLAFAEFAGLTLDHVNAIMTALACNNALPVKSTVVRGTRLPNDWTLPQAWQAWACEQRRWQPDDTLAEAELFANYWQAKSGKDAVKVAWEKTWRNWVRNSHRPDGTYTGRVVTQTDRAASLRKNIALYERMGREAETGDMRAELARLESNVAPIMRAG